MKFEHYSIAVLITLNVSSEIKRLQIHAVHRCCSLLSSATEARDDPWGLLSLHSEHLWRHPLHPPRLGRWNRRMVRGILHRLSLLLLCKSGDCSLSAHIFLKSDVVMHSIFVQSKSCILLAFTYLH